MTPQDRARQLRPIIVKASASLNNDDALDAIELFDPWEANVDYIAGKRLSYEKKLWEVVQNHKSLAQYPPSIHTAALYTEVPRSGQGDTPGNPIPYDNNMELHLGKYYSQFGVVYVCIRDSEIPLYNNLADLVGNYVEVYE